MHIVYRKTCRVCGSNALTKVIDLGEQYLQGSFIKPGKNDPPMRKTPLSLVRCDPTKDEHACGLLQMEHTVPPSILYMDYWYRSGINNTMREHLKGIAREGEQLVGEKKMRVLDIGCNDGTLLNNYSKNFERFGIDPSDVARTVDENITVVNDLFPSKKLEWATGGQKFDIITSIAMFYDLENPVEFVRNIKKFLTEGGVWIFEMAYMPTMLEKCSFDTICHEHLEYYSLAVIEYILKKASMKVVKASLNDINGGSIRCVATHEETHSHDDPGFTEFIQELRQKEFEIELDTDKPYQRFQEHIEKVRDELNGLIRKLKTEGKKIHIYGASTKGNTILQFCGIDNTIIDRAADRNPEKYGAKTLGTNIPIISEEESRAMNPDYYLVLPWHFKKEFLERERETMEKGTGFIFPLPRVNIVKK